MNNNLITNLEYLGNVDWYKLCTNNLTAEYCITFCCLLTSIHLGLFDKSGNLINEYNLLSRENKSILVRLSKDATYYIQVSSLNGYHDPVKNKYQLDIVGVESK